MRKVLPCKLFSKPVNLSQLKAFPPSVRTNFKLENPEVQIGKGTEGEWSLSLHSIAHLSKSCSCKLFQKSLAISSVKTPSTSLSQSRGGPPFLCPPSPDATTVKLPPEPRCGNLELKLELCPADPPLLLPLSSLCPELPNDLFPRL